MVISQKELVTGLLQFLVRIWSLWFLKKFIFFSLCACVWFINSCHFTALITEAPVFPQLISRGFHQSYMAQPYQNRALQSGTSASFKKWKIFSLQNTGCLLTESNETQMFFRGKKRMQLFLILLFTSHFHKHTYIHWFELIYYVAHTYIFPPLAHLQQ